jgi:hypothetical protein
MRAVGPIVALSIMCFLLSGCAALRPGEQSLLQTETDNVLAAVASSAPPDGGFRGTGEADLKFSGRTIKTTFAAVYSRRGWLRADLRPSYGSLGSSLAAQALMEDGCVGVYFPAKLVEITGCLSDIVGDATSFDPAALVLGLPDPTLVNAIENVTGARRGGAIVVTGQLNGASAVLEIDEAVPAITKIRIGDEDTGGELTISYEGYGWKRGVIVPRTVSLSAFEGTTKEVAVEIRYDTARLVPSVDRASYALSVPAGVSRVDWRELSVWR